MTMIPEAFSLNLVNQRRELPLEVMSVVQSERTFVPNISAVTDEMIKMCKVNDGQWKLNIDGQQEQQNIPSPMDMGVNRNNLNVSLR